MGNRLRELLADLCHEQWCGWMKHLFSKCTPTDDGDLIIPAEYVSALHRQMGLPYAELSDEEKDSDRREARKFIDLLKSNYDGMHQIYFDTRYEIPGHTFDGGSHDRP